MQTPKVIRRSFKGNKLYLLPLGDIHIGAPNCELEKARGFVNWAIEKGASVLGMGDIIENANKGSVGAGVYEQKISPDEQIEVAIEFLKPLADKKLLLGLLDGNHEWRTTKDSGVNITKQICRGLKVPYLGYSIFLYIRVGKITYIIYASHGSTGSTTPQGKLKTILDWGKYIEADVYLMGHVHSLMAHSDIYRRINTTTKCCEDRKRYYVLTGSFLGYYGGYAEQKNYAPERVGAPRIRLDGLRFDAHVSL